jgi:hypothetical protein
VNQTSLMPPRRRAILQRRQSLRRWGAICACCALGLILISICSVAMWGTGSVDPREFSAARDSISHADISLAALRSASSQTHRALQTITEISEQPDWSLLLDAVARAQGDDIFLTDCELALTSGTEFHGPIDPAHHGGSDGLALRLVGMGRSQETISHFVLHLQGLPIFERVKLMETNRQQFEGIPGVGFEVICPLRGQLGAGS